MLNEDYRFHVECIDIVIPFGFEFETSVPRIIWPFLGPTGSLFLAGLIHDFGYRFNPGKRSRKYWDELFYKVAQQEVSRPIAHRVAWFGVRIGGFNAWQNHRRNDK